MKLKLHALDAEIREVEMRIALERGILDDAVSNCTSNLRNAVTSPTALLALTGVGFVIGKLMFGRKSTPGTVTSKAGVLGMLTGVAGTAASLMRPGSSLGALARWAVAKGLAWRHSAQAQAARASSPRPPNAQARDA